MTRDELQNKVVSTAKIFQEKIRDFSFSEMTLREQTFLMKRLSFLISSGVPMLDSLVLLNKQTKKKAHTKILDTIIGDISKGQELSTSLQKFNKIFGDFSINIIAFGESTGMLSDNLEYLAQELKKKDTLAKKIASAFIYPVIVLVATACITLFLMLYLFPKITPVFKSLHIALPLSTKIVMFLSIFLQHYGFHLIIIAIVTAFITPIIFQKNPKIKFNFERLLLSLPLIGDTIKNYNLANITRNMSLLLKSGIPLSEALHIITKITRNPIYKTELEKIQKLTNRGQKISVHLATNPKLFPDILIQVIAVGEQSGNLSESLLYLSELYESEIDNFTKNLGNTIEPFLMILIGAIVGLIAISIITPIYSITQNLTPK